MSDQMKLSQAEIDALLNGGVSVQPQPAAEKEMLTPEEADTLGEIGNINFGSAATSLSTLLQHRVAITTPTVSVIQPEEIQTSFPQPYVLVAVEFTEGLQGSNALAIELNDAKTIADLMMGGDGTNVEGDLNELHLSAVGEAMNQMMGGAATSMSQMFGRYINISPPRVDVIDFSSNDRHGFDIDEQIVNVQFQLRVGDLIDSSIMQLLPLRFARDMVRTLQAGPIPESEAKKTEEPVIEQAASTPTSATTVSAFVSETDTAMTQTAATKSSSIEEPPTLAVPQVRVQQPEFMEFDEDNRVPVEQRNLSLLFDVPLNVTVELGRAKKMVREILELSSGSILELDKLAGEPVDILVNQKRIAIGEVVVIDENFGVRVTDIISTEKRVGKLTQ